MEAHTNIVSGDNNTKDIYRSSHNGIPHKQQGPAVFGYKWKDGCLMIDEKEAAIRILIFEFFIKTKRKKTTATMLNNLGCRTRNGSLFSHTTINRLLRDTTAKGIFAKQQKAVNGCCEPGISETDTCAYILCPSIISDEVWNECQALLQQSKDNKQQGPQTAYLLSGYLYCRCGRSMYVYHRNKYPAFRCRRCKTKILVDDIEAIYHEQLRPFFLIEYDGTNQGSNYEGAKSTESVYTEWTKLSVETKRLIIEAITQKVIVFTNTIDIHFVKKIITHSPINVGKSEQITCFRIVNKYQAADNEMGSG